MPTAIEAASWTVTEVGPDVRLLITRGMPALDRVVDDQVEVLWQRAKRERPLFNGQVFCADQIETTAISGHWTEYRRAVAQMSDHGLADVLGIRSLAVCGVVCCRGSVALGRREARSVYQPGEWQLPPAGSVDSTASEPGGASWRRALLGELREELGVGAEYVRALRPLCLVQHPSGVLDLGIAIDTDLDADDVLDAHARGGNGEYDQLRVLPPEQVAGWVAGQGGRLVPSALAFLERLNPAEPGASTFTGFRRPE